MRYDIIVDGQGLSTLVYITDVERAMGPVVKNRVIKVTGYIINDVLNTVDVLNRLLTGDMQEFIFTDQPDRFWRGYIKENITPSNCESWAEIEFSIVVPDGVAYAVEPTELRFSGQTSIVLENNGTEAYYPTFDFYLNSPTYMVSAIAKSGVFQFGESIEASPLKEVKISRQETEAGYSSVRKQKLVSDRWKNLTTTVYDVSKINSNWRTSGQLSLRSSDSPAVVGGEVKIAKHATYWQTGERMANWVKGKTFDVARTKSVNQSKSKKAYLLRNRGVYIGWLLEQDIEGSNNPAAANDMVAEFSNTSAYNWHGPAARYRLDGRCTDFETHTWLNFYLSVPQMMGAFYFAVMKDDQVICSIGFSSHQNNMNTWISFFANGSGLDAGYYDKTMVTKFWGRCRMRKEGNRFTFEVYNELNKQTFSKSYAVAKSDDLTPTHILVWCGKYSNFQTPKEISLVRTYFEGLNTQVWVEPKTETVTDIYNLPDPQYTFSTGDMIRLESETNKAYVNGKESLTPVAYGSKAIKIPPGSHEVMLVTSGEDNTAPDVEVRYREVFR